jgi:hypothetical protein
MKVVIRKDGRYLLRKLIGKEVVIKKEMKWLGLKMR